MALKFESARVLEKVFNAVQKMAGVTGAVIWIKLTTGKVVFKFLTTCSTGRSKSAKIGKSI